MTTFTHTVSCPICARTYEVKAPSAEPPEPMPCAACWRDMAPAAKTPYLRRLRAAPVERRVCGHRDPVKDAPPTLRAYVELLEAELYAQRGAR